MKNIITIIFISLIALTACEYEDDRLDFLTENSAPSFVRFNENLADTLLRSEDFKDTIRYSVELGIRIYEDAMYRVALKGDAVYGIDYVIVNDSELDANQNPVATIELASDYSYVDITFPRNDTISLSHLGVVLLEDGVNDGDKVLTLELDTAYALNYGPLQVGRGPFGEKKSLKISDIDCAIVFSAFSDQEVTITEIGSPDDPSDDFTYMSKLVATSTPGTYLIENFGGWGVATQVKIILDNAYGVSIPSEPQPGLLTAIGNFLGADLTAAEPGSVQGTGSFTTCPGAESITITFNYLNAEDVALFNPSVAVITL